MRQAIPQLASFMDRPRRLRRAVASDPTWKRKLLEELLQSSNIFSLVRIHLRIDALKIAVRQRRRGPMSRPGDINQIQIVLLDQTVQMHPHKRLSGVRTPMSQQSVFDLLRLQRLPQQRVLQKIKHSKAKGITGSA